MLWHKLTCILVMLAGSAGALDQISVEASLDVEQQTVTGAATYQISPRGAEYEAIRFRLYPNLLCEDDTIPCGIQVDSAIIGGGGTLEFTANGTDLLVNLPQKIGANDSLDITLYFRNNIPDQRGRFGYHKGLFNLEAWFPYPAPWRDGGWFQIDYCDLCEPVGEHYNIDVTFELPDSLTLMAAGVVATTETADSRTKVQLSLHPAQDLALSVASDFQLHQFETDGVTVNIWHRPDRAYALDTTQIVTTRTLEIMTDLVGKYPFDELVIVVGALNTGEALELPRLLWMNQPGMFAFLRVYQTMLIHEIAHQWFYGVVASDQANEPWLDEAVTEYFNDEVNRILSDNGPDLLDQFGMTAGYRELHRMSSQSAWEMYPITLGAHSYSLGRYAAVVYSKGALIMRTLTNLMGEEGGRQFWRTYYDTFKFARPTPNDFFQTAAVYFPTGDPDDVRKLVETTIRTDYAVDSIAVRDSTLEVVGDAADDDSIAPETIKLVDVVISSTHPLSTEIVLRVEFADGSTRDTSFVPIGGREAITFENDSPPVAAILDPDGVYAIDANLLNNSLQLYDGAGNGLRLFSGILYMVESLFSSVWGI